MSCGKVGFEAVVIARVRGQNHVIRARRVEGQRVTELLAPALCS